MSKKSKLAYVGMGAIATIATMLLIGLYLQITYNEDPYRIMRNSGMSSTINEEESIELDRNFPFVLIAEGDIIAFYGKGMIHDSSRSYGNSKRGNLDKSKHR